MSEAKLPKTIDEAAELILSLMSDDDKDAVRNTPLDEFAQLHMGLGSFIRNRCGLWNQSNPELLGACGGVSMHPDSASMIIIGKIWQKLNGYSDEDIVAPLANVALREALEILDRRRDEY